MGISHARAHVQLANFEARPVASIEPMASAQVLQSICTQGNDNESQGAGSLDSERLAYVQDMRSRFSPPAMLALDGSIRQEFFKPEKVVILDDKKWGPAEKDLLYKGLEKYGVGKWRDISQTFLPRWDDQSLRLKAARMLGSQSLARYVGWKGSPAAVDQEYQKNKELGESIGCWKGGVLVEDTAGSVQKALAARDR